VGSRDRRRQAPDGGGVTGGPGLASCICRLRDDAGPIAPRRRRRRRRRLLSPRLAACPHRSTTHNTPRPHHTTHTQTTSQSHSVSPLSCPLPSWQLERLARLDGSLVDRVDLGEGSERSSPPARARPQGDKPSTDPLSLAFARSRLDGLRPGYWRAVGLAWRSDGRNGGRQGGWCLRPVSVASARRGEMGSPPSPASRLLARLYNRSCSSTIDRCR
jgi:hypothetical protein